MIYELFPNYVPPSPFASKSGGHDPPGPMGAPPLVRPDAHRLSPTSQIGQYPGEDIASYTETTTQALEQYGMVNGIESCAQIE